MSNVYPVFWKSEDTKALLDWWQILPKKGAWCAELRRAQTPADVLLCQGFRYLCYDLAGFWTSESNILGLAAVAGIISHLKINNGTTFATACATPPAGKSKAPVSELRFAQLQKSRTLDEFFARMVRMTHLLGEAADPVSVANDTLQWFTESVKAETASDPRKSILVRWGFDYFQHLPRETSK